MRLTSQRSKQADITAAKTGQIAEGIAAQYLIEKGLRLLETNFSSRFGEIDIIMQDQQTLVFVEVKYRASSQFGGAIAAISASKQKKIKQTAAFYLQEQELNAYNTDHRFDVITLDGNINKPEINWLTNAF